MAVTVDEELTTKSQTCCEVGTESGGSYLQIWQDGRAIEGWISLRYARLFLLAAKMNGHWSSLRIANS